ncbi:hypothetical protein CRM22_006238, partial [Opisthorchis felineus]
MASCLPLALRGSTLLLRAVMLFCSLKIPKIGVLVTTGYRTRMDSTTLLGSWHPVASSTTQHGKLLDSLCSISCDT